MKMLVSLIVTLLLIGILLMRFNNSGSGEGGVAAEEKSGATKTFEGAFKGMKDYKKQRSEIIENFGKGQ